MRLEKFEPRSGGMWRYIHKDKDGTEYGFHGVIHEVLPPERIIDTFEYEGLPEKGHVALQTLRLQELPGGRTKLTAQAVFQSVADRDGMIQSGAEEGMNESYERLDELLKEQREASGTRKLQCNRPQRDHPGLLPPRPTRAGPTPLEHSC